PLEVGRFLSARNRRRSQLLIRYAGRRIDQIRIECDPAVRGKNEFKRWGLFEDFLSRSSGESRCNVDG
ncbi:hypothetical protein N9B60_04520, partial [Mariniblastus sp.]|nr:hypothetical protein [Mariniblastus sp.]